MIAVYIDPAIEKYNRQVRYSIEYLLEMSGFFWKYLEADTELSPNDLILYYSVNLPADDYVDWLTKHFSFIYIPFIKDFYLPGFYNGDSLRNYIKYFKYETEIPIISAKKFTKAPLNLTHRKDNLYAYFEFDLIGNIFFHLSNDEKNHLNKKDKKGNLCLEELSFFQHFEIPYINYYIDIFAKLVSELVSKKKIEDNNSCFMIKRALWPSNQPIAAILSHNLDKLQKWNVISLFLSFFEHFYLLISFRWKYFFRSFISKYKYFFTNQEDYWNFYDISFYERKFKFSSTWFIGVNQNKERIYDYNIEDSDLTKELYDLYSHGSEICLLTSKIKQSGEELRKDIERFMSHLNINNKRAPNGIRRTKDNLDNDNHNKVHAELNFKYSSCERINDRNCFLNGLALPYPVYFSHEIKNRNQLWEFPITFSDEALNLTKYKTVPFDTAMNSVKSLIKSTKKVNGLVHFQFSNSNFYEIPYMHKLFEYTIDQLKHQGAFVAPCSVIFDWLEKRRDISINEKEYSIEIQFNKSIEQICFEVIGNKVISKVEGGNCNYQKNHVQFINVTQGLIVEIFVIDLEPVFEEEK